MKWTIGALWNGDICPGEKCGVDNAEIKELIGLMQKNREELLGDLNEEQKKRLEKYISTSDEYEYLLAEQAFCDGFCLAGRLLTEALT